tara:strand:+ start:6038 stop:6718 length:681 start_codon:yes stop_codon:yes gene_type:complete
MAYNYPTKLTSSGLVSDAQGKIDALIDTFNLASEPANGKILIYNSTTEQFEVGDQTGGGGTPAGSDTEIQFNNSGSFGADSNFKLLNAGGGTSCTLSHKGHLNIGLHTQGVITSSEPTLQIHKDADDSYKLTVFDGSQSSGTPEDVGGPGTKHMATGWINFFPEDIAGSGSSYLQLKRTPTNDLQVNFNSGGSGDLKVMMTDLPTSDPTNAGQLWNDSGTLKVSSG